MAKKKKANTHMRQDKSRNSVLDGEKIEKVVIAKRPCFKNSDFKSSLIIMMGKKPIKSLKQIYAYEKTLNWLENSILYKTITATPSLKPAKKYADLTGIPSLYTDPQTKLRYNTSEEFQILRTLPSDIISGYLVLRGENTRLP